jgi:vacuolar-type H+-ATPase subunit H
LSNAGNIAEAAIEINNCFQSAQKAAEQYLNEIKAIREETEAERQKILKDAKAEVEAIIGVAKKTQCERDALNESASNEFKQNCSDNG